MVVMVVLHIRNISVYIDAPVTSAPLIVKFSKLFYFFWFFVQLKTAFTITQNKTLKNALCRFPGLV